MILRDKTSHITIDRKEKRFRVFLLFVFVLLCIYSVARGSLPSCLLIFHVYATEFFFFFSFLSPFLVMCSSQRCIRSGKAALRRKILLYIYSPTTNPPETHHSQSFDTTRIVVVLSLLSYVQDDGPTPTDLHPLSLNHVFSLDEDFSFSFIDASFDGDTIFI